MLFRQSLLKTWMACPLQAKYAHIDGLPQPENFKAAFGTVIHYCLERFNTDLAGDVDAAIEIFDDIWANPEKLGLNPTVMPRMTSYSGLRQRGPEILRDYARRLVWENREVLATEHTFLVPFGRHAFTGTVDLVELRRNHKGKDLVRVVDFKTNSRKPMITELAYNIQFTVYTWASLQREFWVGNGEDYPAVPYGEEHFEAFAEVPRRGIWVHLWTGSELDAGTRDEADFRRLHRLCDEIERAIEAEVFVPDISAATCGICPYTEPCGVDLDRAKGQREEELSWVG